MGHRSSLGCSAWVSYLASVGDLEVGCLGVAVKSLHPILGGKVPASGSSAQTTGGSFQDYATV